MYIRRLVLNRYIQSPISHNLHSTEGGLSTSGYRGDIVAGSLLVPESRKVAEYFVNKSILEEQDLVLLSGLGSAWPLIRSHSLLNSLHPFIQNTPLVIFYPGKFDGQGLGIFSWLKQSNYYRAFRLVA